MLRGQAEEGRNLRGLSGLQQEDPPHGLASAGERHRGGSYQQSLSVSRELLTSSSSSPSTSNALATLVGCCRDFVAGDVSLKKSEDCSIFYHFSELLVFILQGKAIQ